MQVLIGHDFHRAQKNPFRRPAVRRSYGRLRQPEQVIVHTVIRKRETLEQN